MRRRLIVGAVAVVAVVAAHAATIIDEDFQSPLFSDGTANPAFPGWTWVGGPKSVRADSRGDGMPGLVATPNQALHYEWTSAYAVYDTSHGWATNEGYTISVNASPQEWSGSVDRHLRVSLYETGGTLLWTETRLLPKYTNTFEHAPWTASQTFDYVVWGSELSTGTPGQPLRLEVATVGNRGVYIDNISLISGPPPEDTNAPTPNAMTWEIPPENGDYGYVTMKSSLGFDTAGIEYNFTNTTRGTSSGWQLGRVWDEGGLEHGQTYTYMVKARDLSPNQNETDWSAPADVTTWSVENGTILITGFQLPVKTGSNPYFEGWDFNEPGSTYVNQSPSGGTPGGPTNRVVEFNQISATGSYDTDHAWTRHDEYTLRFNSAPNSWGGSAQRYAEVSLRQTDGTVLWSASTPVPLHDPSFDGADPWPEELTFTFTIYAKDFVSGTEGELLQVHLAHSGGSRSLYFDNIFLFEEPPTGMLLILQ